MTNGAAATQPEESTSIKVRLLDNVTGRVLVNNAKLTLVPEASELAKRTMLRLGDMSIDPRGVNITITHPKASGRYRVRSRRRNFLSLERQEGVKGDAQFQLA